MPLWEKPLTLSSRLSSCLAFSVMVTLVVLAASSTARMSFAAAP